MYALDPIPETVAPNRACASAHAMRAKGRTARAQGKNRNDNPSEGVRLCVRICARIRTHMKLGRTGILNRVLACVRGTCPAHSHFYMSVRLD